jgi:1-phosphofructokinase
MNPAIDKTIFVEEHKINELHRVEKSTEDIGGKGINVSKVVHLLGGSTIATGFIGGYNGEKIRNYLKEQGIKEAFVDTGISTRTNIKIVDTKNQTMTEFNEKGLAIPNDSIQALREVIINYSKQADFMVFSGSLPKEFAIETYCELLRLAKQQTKVVVDADGEVLRQSLEISPFMIKPNIKELGQLINVHNLSEEVLIIKLKDLLKTFNIEIILLSKGRKGSLLITKDQCYNAETISVQVKSTVGAGDSMLGGFLTSYIDTNQMYESFRFAVAAGTSAVTTEGTKLFSKEIFYSIIKKVNIRSCI